jgi:peptide/nickel transport system substrate-binding protein
MNTSTSLNYYRSGTASQIFWPQSTVSWAYPKNPDGSFDNDNGMNYPYIGTWTADKNGNGIYDGEEAARANIQELMDIAGVEPGDAQLKIEFTIAGASTDHPTFQTFIDAAALLNSMGWNITVIPDATALTKLSSGGLTVWAAAWGSTLDPDMYQVYHKNSTASSTRAWGYSYIKTEGGYQEELLDKLSEKIDEARETLDQEERAEIYKDAMEYLLELAVELPVYQRSVVYAYNSNVIDASSLPEGSNPYSSPLDRIWEIEFKD